MAKTWERNSITISILGPLLLLNKATINQSEIFHRQASLLRDSTKPSVNDEDDGSQILIPITKRQILRSRRRCFRQPPPHPPPHPSNPFLLPSQSLFASPLFTLRYSLYQFPFNYIIIWFLQTYRTHCVLFQQRSHFFSETVYWIFWLIKLIWIDCVLYWCFKSFSCVWLEQLYASV